MVQQIRISRSAVSVKNCPRITLMLKPANNKTTVHKDLGIGVGKWEAMWLCHNRESQSLFDCEEEEEELKVVIKYKEKALSSWDSNIAEVNYERKRKILDGYVKQLMESSDLDATKKIKDMAATKKIKDMVIGDSKLAAGLKPMVFERLVEILEENNNESTKGSAICILGFANLAEWSDDIIEKATEVLVKLMSDKRDMIAVPVLRTLTRLAYIDADYANFIIENGALNGAWPVNVEPIFLSFKRIQNLTKFLVVVVRRLQRPDDKVAVVSILDEILKIRKSNNLRCIVRACYMLSCINVDLWINKGNILYNIFDLIWHYNDMIASSALRVAAYIVKFENSCKILTKHYKFLHFLGRSEICCKPKKFQKEACHIIWKMAANGGTSIKDLEKSGLMDALFTLLEVADFDVRMGAACAIRNVMSCHRQELASMTRDVTVSQITKELACSCSGHA